MEHCISIQRKALALFWQRRCRPGYLAKHPIVVRFKSRLAAPFPIGRELEYERE